MEDFELYFMSNGKVLSQGEKCLYLFLNKIFQFVEWKVDKIQYKEIDFVLNYFSESLQ